MLDFQCLLRIIRIFEFIHFNLIKLLIISLVLMESDPTDTLELAEFKQIIINTIHINLHDYHMEEEGEQESKHNEDQENFPKEGSELQQTLRIESIKDITSYKDELGIIDLIQNELGVQEDEVSIWNKMICSISKFRISVNLPLNNKSTSSLS